MRLRVSVIGSSPSGRAAGTAAGATAVPARGVEGPPIGQRLGRCGGLGRLEDDGDHAGRERRRRRGSLRPRPSWRRCVRTSRAEPAVAVVGWSGSDTALSGLRASCRWIQPREHRGSRHAHLCRSHVDLPAGGDGCSRLLASPEHGRWGSSEHPDPQRGDVEVDDVEDQRRSRPRPRAMRATAAAHPFER